MVSDSTENVHWGLINMGGYTNFNAMTPGQRQNMYAMERSNMIASRTMGRQRYMDTVRHQNRGVIHGGDDTGMGQEKVEAEEEETNEDNIFAPEVSDMEQVLSTFRNEPNVCLEPEEWNDAVIFQHGVMRILNAFGNIETVSEEVKGKICLQLADQLQPLIQRHRDSNPNLSEKYQQYAGQVREMANLPGCCESGKYKGCFSCRGIRATPRYPNALCCSASFSRRGMAATPRQHNAVQNVLQKISKKDAVEKSKCAGAMHWEEYNQKLAPWFEGGV